MGKPWERPPTSKINKAKSEGIGSDTWITKKKEYHD